MNKIIHDHNSVIDNDKYNNCDGCIIEKAIFLAKNDYGNHPVNWTDDFERGFLAGRKHTLEKEKVITTIITILCESVSPVSKAPSYLKEKFNKLLDDYKKILL